MPVAEDGSWVPDSFYATRPAAGGSPVPGGSSGPTDVAVNPNDKAQRYVLWGNGRVDDYGGAPPITGQTTWFDSLIPMPVAVAIHITNWATGAGYLFDLYGGFHPFNGAPAISQPTGVPYVANARNYTDWAWHPAGNGQGYALSVYGQLHEFGGATPAPRQGGRWTEPFAKKLQMSWAGTLRAITLDAYGGLHPDFGAVVGTASAYWPHQDYARDFAVTDWATGSGHVLDLFGAVHEFGAAPDTWGWPYRPGADVARCLAVLSAADPRRFWQVWSGGQQFEYVSSSPPRVAAGGSPVKSPPQITTTTTRPTLAWAYGDLQNDRLALWQLLVFTQDFVTAHDMTDPFRWQANALVVAAGSDPATRGYVPEVDFPNGRYVMFVAVQDSAGQWSPWSGYGWEQNVPTPPPPTGLVAVADEDTFSVALSVTATNTGDVLLFIRVEASDDGGLTWATVRGAGAIPLPGSGPPVLTATDRDIPLGVTRTYRATVYADNPRVTSPPSTTATARLERLTFVLTAVDDPALGGEVDVEEPVEWTRPVSAGVFQGLGDDYPTVVSDGRPKSRRAQLHAWSLDQVSWQRLSDLAESDSTLVFRDPFGEVRYCRLVGDWKRAQVVAAPTPGELTPVRHAHTTDLDLVEVRPPT